jgi:hypothetical protein
MWMNFHSILVVVAVVAVVVAVVAVALQNNHKAAKQGRPKLFLLQATSLFSI